MNISNLSNNFNRSELYLRVISAAFLLPPVLFSIYHGGLLFYLLMVIVLFISCYEWGSNSGRWSFGIDDMSMISFISLAFTSIYMGHYILGFILVALGLYLTYLMAALRLRSDPKPVIPNYLNRKVFYPLGMIYISAGVLSIGYLQQLGLKFLLFVFLGTVISDVCAYFVGSILKGKKIAPKISPNKSWSGFVGAVAGTSVMGYLFSIYTDSANSLLVIIIASFIALFAHIGDMSISAFKRYVGIKDMSNLIPGHGGLLDRVDALFIVALYVAVVSIFIPFI